MATFLSRKAFALSQGWSPSYVTKLGNSGRLVLSADGKSVDVEATLALIGKTADPSKDAVAERHAKQRLQRDVYAEVSPHSAIAPMSTVANYHSAKANREHYLALLAKAEFERTCGETVDRRAVEDAAYRAGRLLRDTLLGLPKQISSELAGMSDPWALEQYLTTRMRQALEDVARLNADDLHKAMQ
ncbi:hypothetical protein [Aquitalea sp. ASV11]|uniref:hypothetical protein n=1 Tax=Aquitalea sp. ASV11 TaxID=2795103 RepID=UPI0018ED6AA7|nr:hypothetical protein [Aquitalea sp. ASV11]